MANILSFDVDDADQVRAVHFFLENLCVALDEIDKTYEVLEKAKSLGTLDDGQIRAVNKKMELLKCDLCYSNLNIVNLIAQMRMDNGDR